MNSKIKVVIADDHDIYLEGLELNLKMAGDIEVIASAVNGKKLVEMVRQYHPDVVITDIKMPDMDGIEAILAISRLGYPVRSLVLSSFDNNYLVLEALEAGAKGYVLKDAPKADVITAVRTVYEDIPYYCSRTTTSLARLLKRSHFNPSIISRPELFTPLERQIIHFVCEEKTSEDIGKELHIGKRSIENYRRAILAKMKVKSLAGMIVFAIKNKLYPLTQESLPRDKW